MKENRLPPPETDHLLIEPLTSRELEVLKLFAAGFSNKEIADQLMLAVSTIKWYARQIFSKLAVNSRSEAVELARKTGIIENDPRLSRLPTPATPFIGRLDELRAIKRLLSRPHNRLVTLVSLGGTGKTRLAIQTAEEIIAAGKKLYRDGVYFVSLESVFETDALISAVAGALGFQFYEGGTNAQGQLVDYLRGKRLLLVLDNYEQLICESSAELLAEMLQASPGLKILITSRERLNQPGEQVYAVGGLHLPDSDALEWVGDAKTFEAAYSSVALFLQTARRTQADFNPDAVEMKAIGEICQLVEGMPLGIELAAAWVPVLRPRAFLEEIRGSLDILETDMYAVPARQRSLRAIFDASWKLLSEDERRAIIRLSVFRGGFTRRSAAHVAGVSIKALHGLANKSWIQILPDGRYNFHPVIQFYASEAAGGQSETIKQRHAEYFCGFISECRDGLYGLRQKETLIEIEAEISNLQDAWKTAIGLERFDLIYQAADGYCTYFDLRSRFDEGARACEKAFEVLQRAQDADRSAPGIQSPCLLVILLTWGAHFTRDYQKQANLIGRAQALFDDPGFPHQDCQPTQAQLWCVRGQHIAWEDRMQAGEYFQRSMELADRLGDRYLQALAMSSLGWITWVTGDAHQARKHLQMSLDIRREIGDQRGIAYCLNMLGILARDRGRFGTAKALQRESLALLEEIGASFQIAQHEYVFGSTVAFQGDFDKALQITTRSVRRLDELGYRGPFLAKPYHIKGNILLDLGRYEEAQASAHQGLMIAKQYNNQQEFAYALGVLGAVYLIRADYETALEYLTESYERFKAINHFHPVIPVLRLASAYRAVGNLQQALDYLKIAIKMLVKSKNALFVGHALFLAALCLADLGAEPLAVTVYTLSQQYPNIANSRWAADLNGGHMREFMAPLPSRDIREAEAQAEELDIWDALRLTLDEIESIPGNLTK